MKLFHRHIIAAFILLSVCACQGKKKNMPTVITKADTLVFQEDSAYAYLQKQVDFGPRVPNTAAHKACGNYLEQQLRTFGAIVLTQETQVKAYNGAVLNIKNIIASYQPEKERRVLLFAHWDSRPWADQDPLPENRQKAISGANDGGSGTAVLLEIARLLHASAQPGVGIDIILFDAEDYGEPLWIDGKEDSWCLGTQYWCKHPHKEGYRAEYGILLDMVGAKNACFLWEYFSMQYAEKVLSKVWDKASELGYGAYFMSSAGGGVTDDHLYVNRLRGIPCIDIIDYNDNGTGFFPYWHTLEDHIGHIDKNTLKATGQTLLEVLYSE